MVHLGFSSITHNSSGVAWVPQDKFMWPFSLGPCTIPGRCRPGGVLTLGQLATTKLPMKSHQCIPHSSPWGSQTAGVHSSTA